jgi:uncharacterized membrane protein
VAVAAAAGLFFAGFSTYDFAAHLDRQVHSIHCSFVPGIAEPDSTGSTGCAVTLMSPYSSVMRHTVWGGIPVSLPAMAVFAFLLFWALDLVFTRRQEDPRATGFLLLATVLPLGTSLVMGWLALSKLDAACKLCIGIYGSSALAFAGALWLWRHAVGAARTGPRPLVAPAAPAPADGLAPGDALAGPNDRTVPALTPPTVTAAVVTSPAADEAPETISWLGLAGAFGLGVLFVAVPLLVYLAAMPDFFPYTAGCGRLERPEDKYGVMLPLGGVTGGKPVIEVLDPLCPACKGFEERLRASGLASKLDRRAALFPLDSTCNWMVSSAVHPGACTVSEAMLCAGDKAGDVLKWAFAEQDKIRSATAADPTAAAKMVAARFPELAGCVGTPAARSKLNKALRWAVENALPVLTPQLYVDGTKLCDEDTDLGLDYVLGHMLAGDVAVSTAEPATSAASAAPDTGVAGAADRTAGTKATAAARPDETGGAAATAATGPATGGASGAASAAATPAPDTAAPSAAPATAAATAAATPAPEPPPPSTGGEEKTP